MSLKDDLELNRKLIESLSIYGDRFWREGLTRLRTGPSIWLVSEMAKLVARPTTEPSLKMLVLEYLHDIPDSAQGAINEICQVWMGNRPAGLESLIVERGWIATQPVKARVLTSLKVEGYVSHRKWTTGEEIKALAEAVGNRRKDPAMIEAARLYLEKLPPQSLPIVARVWLSNGSPVLLERLSQTLDKAVNLPLEARLRLALHLDRPAILAEAGPELAEPLVEACYDPKKPIAARAREWLPTLQNKALQKNLCEIVIKRELPEIEKLIVEAGWQPADTSRRALFFFVTGQYDRYESLDFDGRILRLSYQNAVPDLQRRLAAAIRKSGRTDYLGAITGGESQARAAEITREEAALLLQILSANQAWAKLWELVPILPLDLSIEAVVRLQAAGWRCPEPMAQATFEQLAALAGGEIETELTKLTTELPLAFERATLSLPRKSRGRINDIAFAPGLPRLALALNTGKIVLWNWQTGQLERTLSNAASRSIGQVQFVDDERLVWAERTNNSTTPCKVYLWQDNQIHLLGQHFGSIQGLEIISPEVMVSVGADHMLKVWHLPSRSLWKEETIYGQPWLQGIVLSPDRRELVVLHDGLHLYNLPDLTLHSLLNFNDFGVVPRAVFSPDQRSLLITKKESFPRVARRNQHGKFEPTLEILKHLPKQTESYQAPGAASLPALNLALIGYSTGSFELMDWKTYQSIGQLSVPVGKSGRLLGFNLSADGGLLATFDEESVVTLLDLRALALRRLLDHPLAQADLAHLTAITVLRQNMTGITAPLSNLLSYIELIIKDLKLRYAIEISDLPMLQAGQFDIEIEG